MIIPTSQELRANLYANDYDYMVTSDQKKGLPKPLAFKPYDKDAEIIDLPDYKNCELKNDSLTHAMENRASRRFFTDDPITLQELSYLLYFTQGVRGYKLGKDVMLRVVPSAGARHSFETYLACINVEGLKQGIYRYLPMEHKLLLVKEYGNELIEKLSNAAHPVFTPKSPVTFIWSTIPYRSEWRYPTHAHKVILIDVGHVCENLYLACEALNCGTCAIGAYNQNLSHELCCIDGDEEFVIYMSSVGHI